MGITTSVHADENEGQTTETNVSSDKVTDPTQQQVALQNKSTAGDNTQAAADNGQSAAPASPTTAGQSTAPAATTSLNDQVGKGITVTEHTVTESDYSKNSGKAGTINLHLGLQITTDEARQIKSGDYIDVKLGLPYGDQVFSYGLPASTSTSKTGYWIVPTGNLTGHSQTVAGEGATIADPKWTTNVNNNIQDVDNHGSNGYYRIIFTDQFRDLVKTEGSSTGISMTVNLNWQNASQNGDTKGNKPSAGLTLYTNSTTASTYTPDDDVQVGNDKLASGISIKTQPKQTPLTVQVTKETEPIDHTGSTPAHTWI